MSMRQQIQHAADVLIDVITIPTQTLGLDLDGVIDEDSQFFRTLTEVWPGKVYVITYRDDRAKAIADLDRFGVRYDDVILVNSFAEKAEVIARLGVNIYIDDQDEVLMHIPERVTVLKMRNGGNYDSEERKWLYSDTTGRPV